jgi:hypothetical protein
MGVLLQLWWVFLTQCNDHEKIRWDECFANGSFIPAKNGGLRSARSSGARARSGWYGSMARVLRWGQSLEAASLAEVMLLERTLNTVAVRRPGIPSLPRQWVERLIADRGYGSNPLRAYLARRGIDPIIPVRRNHKRATHQNGRKLQRYRWRWIVERTFA